MKTHNFLGWVVVSAMALLAWRTPADSAFVAEDITGAANAFTFDLYARLAKQEGNLVLSPWSADTALAMTYAGARGQTAAQMAGVLHLPPLAEGVHPGFSALLKQLKADNSSGCELVVANSLWSQQGFDILQPFQKITRDYYGAYLRQVDFKGAREAARLEINNWVTGQSQGKIAEILSPDSLDSATLLVLVNAAYFKGRWAKEFDKAVTKDAPFHLGSGASTAVPTMHLHGEFRYTETDTLQVLELPYLSNRFSMAVLLPKAADGLRECEQAITASRIDALQRTSRLEHVSVCLPRFNISSEFQLACPLTNMGMTDAFTPTRAEFSGIANEKPLFIAEVAHKSYVDVNEKGTEAGSATAVRIPLSQPERKVIFFNADHPFLFLIRHNPTGTILFLGRVSNPVS